MPCPHFSSENGDCLLQHDRDEDDDEQPVAEAVDHDWCLSGDKAYRNCPVYRQFLGEMIP